MLDVLLMIEFVLIVGVCFALLQFMRRVKGSKRVLGDTLKCEQGHL